MRGGNKQGVTFGGSPVQSCEAVHILGRGVAGRQGQQLAHQVGVAGLHGKVEGGVALLLLGARTVQQLGHRLHVPVLGRQLQRCEALGVLHTHPRASQSDSNLPVLAIAVLARLCGPHSTDCKSTF